MNVYLFTYGECAQGEDEAEYYLLLFGELRLYKYRHGQEDNHEVGGDVEHRVRDQVVRRRGALDW